jgi:hypothetical protein
MACGRDFQRLALPSLRIFLRSGDRGRVFSGLSVWGGNPLLSFKISLSSSNHSVESRVQTGQI